jgi:predicted Fe-Mo cluster-binding NifX family protein
MRIAVTAQGEGLDAAVDPRFGRARCFVVVDTETGASSTIDNADNLDALLGAGVQAGRRIVELGVDAVITGHVGPKAFSALQAGRVAIYTGASGTVAEAVEQYKAGKLTRAEAADVEGHWV